MCVWQYSWLSYDWTSALKGIATSLFTDSHISLCEMKTQKRLKI